MCSKRDFLYTDIKESLSEIKWLIEEQLSATSLNDVQFRKIIYNLREIRDHLVDSLDD